MLAAPFAKAKDALQEQVDAWRRQETDHEPCAQRRFE
jgi:hypothetical protein